MENFKKKLVVSSMLLGLPLCFGPAVYAAKAVDLSHQTPSILQTFVSPAGALASSSMNMTETSRSLDFKNTLHVRVQQTYAGYEVWGADAVIHIPHGESLAKDKSLTNAFAAATKSGKMNGTMFQGLSADLNNAPTADRSQQVIDSVVTNWQRKVGIVSSVNDASAKRIVFIDASGKANWAYLVSFSVGVLKDGGLPAKPNYIVDAATLNVYANWDNIQTRNKIKTGSVVNGAAHGGGFGGNEKMGKISYDSLDAKDHYAKLNITRVAETKLCNMMNDDVTVEDSRTNKVMSYNCKAVDPAHNDVFWSADLDAVNSGYGPMNDALFGGEVIKNMYFKWYGVPVLTTNGKPMMLKMVVHARMDNAYWDGAKMTFGDGISTFYPLTSLGVAAHEISHGFTEQHSGLAYYAESGGMNEAYSDMAAQAAEYYAYGKNSWQIGPEIFKQADRALRYLDQPSKDCNGKKPGSWCSIDDASQYFSGLDVHFSSGVFNHAFYLMGTAEGWDARKAFDVMVLANQNYWTKTSTFQQGACGVINAAKDLDYDVEVVKEAFKGVKVDTSSCEV